jgi:hypothetical protein
MKRVAYCGQSFLTTDGAADALMRLAVALRAGDSSELVELPALSDHGDAVLVQLVVAPGSEFLTLPEKTLAEDPDTVDAVAFLHERTLALATGGNPDYASAFAGAGTLPDNGWDDLYGL